MNVATRIKNYFLGEQQKEAGRKHGKEIAQEEEYRHNLGSLMINEIQRKKEEINDESNCIKCRRTQRSKCKRHERMALGLDALAGDIAQKYLDMKPQYIEHEEE